LTKNSRVPDATVYRLSLYHCYLGELHRSEGAQRITSGRLAQDLAVKEETVRRDLSFVGGAGRPGSGYDSQVLFAAIQDFLGLEDSYPIVCVGSAQMLEALRIVFPAAAYGVRPVAYCSADPDDVGTLIDGVAVTHVDDMPDLLPSLGVGVALVACAPEILNPVIARLHESGVTGALVMTPSVKLVRPEGMEITHVRMPCDLKSIACRCKTPVAK